jgi:hypothetical protein
MTTETGTSWHVACLAGCVGSSPVLHILLGRPGAHQNRGQGRLPPGSTTRKHLGSDSQFDVCCWRRTPGTVLTEHQQSKEPLVP